jgi:drug/metabolite transporter (DMT)-like permease
MHVLNKTLSVQLKAPALISLVQMAIALGCVGATSFKALAASDRKQIATWMFVPLLFATMLCTSFYSYQYISLSLLTVIRNLTPLIVLPIEMIVMPPDKKPMWSGVSLFSLGMMIAGAALYAGGVRDIKIIGVIFAFVNMFIAISDRLVQRRLLTGECKDLTSCVCTVMNNFWGAFPTIILAACTHQIHGATTEHRADWQDPRIIVLLLLSGLVGIGICYFGFECQRAISATSFFVLQNVSKVAVVLAGVVLFHDPLSNPVSIAGVVLSLLGSFLYSWAQSGITAKALAAKEKAEPPLAKNA